MATYISRTQSSSNQQIFTISTWVKRENFPANSYITNIASDGDNRFGIIFQAGSLSIYSLTSGIEDIFLNTSAQFRDVSAWYHIVLKIDTTQATASDRAKLYVNGTQITSFATANYPTQNLNFPTNNTHYIGCFLSSNQSFNFYGIMSHYHYTDGYAYDASTFGEFDANGVWTPKTSPSVTYGTNGFFLKFENSGSMGLDSSGNTNNFTVNGTLTQTIDSPSNVYATLNPLIPSSSISYSNGNTTFTNSATDHRSVASTLAVSKGKWYAEVKIGNLGGTYPNIGIYNADDNFNSSTYFNQLSGGWSYNANGNVYNNDSSVISGLPTWTTNDIISVAVDCDNDKIYWSKNGTWINSADPSAGTGGQSITADKTWYFAGHSYDSGTDPIQHFNFGNGYFGTTAVASAGSNGNGSIFEYDCPSGYYALNLKNLAQYG